MNSKQTDSTVTSYDDIDFIENQLLISVEQYSINANNDFEKGILFAYKSMLSTVQIMKEVNDENSNSEKR